MSIWIYNNRELLHDTAITYREIYRIYKISQTSIHRYKNTKLYKEYYFSNHRLDEEGIDYIFSNTKTIKINNSSNTNLDINELKNKGYRQYKELQEQYNELKETFNAFILNTDSISNSDISKLYKKIESKTKLNKPTLKESNIDICVLDDIKEHIAPDIYFINDSELHIQIRKDIKKKAKYMKINYLSKYYPVLYELAKCNSEDLELSHGILTPCVKLKYFSIMRYLGYDDMLRNDLLLNMIEDYNDIWPIELLKKYNIIYDKDNDIKINESETINKITNRNMKEENEICDILNKHFIYNNTTTQSLDIKIDYIKQNTNILSKMLDASHILKYLELRPS